MRRRPQPIGERPLLPAYRPWLPCGGRLLNTTRSNGSDSPWRHNSAPPASRRRKPCSFTRSGKPGKLEITPTKPLATQRDLSLAYSPGVAVPVLAIAEDPRDAYDYTNKGNLVAVVSNGTAILGLGNLGALAAKPVMEGKAALFKRFADIDAIDLLVDTEDADAFINCVRYLGPSFGGINLEDIKAPDCFVIEERLKELLDIPVFHDDQHGTAIVVAAGILNGLQGRRARTSAKVKLVCSRRGCRRARLPQPARQDRHEAREHHGRPTSRVSSTRAARS